MTNDTRLVRPEYFLARMEESLHDSEAFLYNLSAFRDCGTVCYPICKEESQKKAGNYGITRPSPV